MCWKGEKGHEQKVFISGEALRNPACFLHVSEPETKPNRLSMVFLLPGAFATFACRSSAHAARAIP